MLLNTAKPPRSATVAKEKPWSDREYLIGEDLTTQAILAFSAGFGVLAVS